MDQPRDSQTFRLAVAGLGLAMAIALVGICLILAFGPSQVVHHVRHIGGARGLGGHSTGTTHSFPPDVPAVLWAFAAAFGGALLGLMLPEPLSKGSAPWVAMALLAAIVLVVLAAGGVSGSPELESLVAASGAALVAILVPTPAAPEPRD